MTARPQVVGWDASVDRHRCRTCRGTGYVNMGTWDGGSLAPGDDTTPAIECPHCHGCGYHDDGHDAE